MQVGLGPGNIMLNGDPASPPPKAHSPQFSAHICCRQIAGWSKMPPGMEVGLDPGDFVVDGDPAPPSPKDRQSLPIFGPCLLWPNSWMDQDGTWHKGGPRSRSQCARWEPSSPSPKRGQIPPNFRPINIVVERLDGSRCDLVRR